MSMKSRRTDSRVLAVSKLLTARIPLPRGRLLRCLGFGFAGISMLFAPTAFAESNIHGRVVSGESPIGNAQVVVFFATTGAPRQLASARTQPDGTFVLTVPDSIENDGFRASRYLLLREQECRTEPEADILRAGQIRRVGPIAHASKQADALLAELHQF